MQSPTTLLSSIQIMKSKLRSDKQTLMDIKNDFTKFNKKPNPYVSNQQQSFILADVSQVSLNKSIRNSSSIDVSQAITKLKKEHQRQIRKLKEQHQRQINQVLRIKALEMQDIENQCKAKLQDQSQYVALLQKQVNNSNSLNIQKTIRQQYDKAIKDLLQHNNRLYSESQKLKQENERLKQLFQQFQSDKSSKSRFKFNKIKKQQSQIQCQPKITRFRTNSLTLNNQNIDRSNIQSDKQWDDMLINEDQLKLKTIRQFQKKGNDFKADRKRTDGYQSLKI